MHILSSFLLLLFSFLHFLLSPHAVHGLTNVTIDDTYGDTNTGAQIIYFPPAAWQLGQNCGNCTAQPDKNQTIDGSWHDATYNPVGGSSNAYPDTLISATALFNGSAVYIYCILTRSENGPDGNTDMAFLIDGNTVGTFEQAPNGDTSYAYNQLVFSSTGLSQGQHNITIVSGRSGDKALVLLDRIVYTTEDDDVTTTIPPVLTAASTSSASASSSTFTTSPFTSSSNLVPTSLSVPSSGASNSTDSATTSSSSSKAGAIVGGVIGSLAGIACIVLLWLYCLAKRKREEVEEAERAIQPFFGRSGRSQAGTGGTTSEMGMMESADMGSSVRLTNADWVARHGHGGMEGESVWRGGGGTATTYLTFPPPPLTGGTSANTHSPETPTFNNNLSTLNTYGLATAGADRGGTRGVRGMLDESTSPTTPDTPSAIRAKYLGLLGFGSSVGSRDGSGRSNLNANASVIERNAWNNVRSEKARLTSLFGGSRSPRSPRHQHPEADHHHPDHPAGTRQHHRTRTRRAGGGVGTGVSPFSPTPLYTPTPGLNNAVSPTTEDEGSVIMSAAASALTEDNLARLTGRKNRSHRERERERERKHDKERERQRARRERNHNHNQRERGVAGRGRALPPRPSRTQPTVQPYYPTQGQARSRSFSFDRVLTDAVPNSNPNPYPVDEKGRPINTIPPAIVPRIAVDPLLAITAEEAPASAEQTGVAADVDADADIRSVTTTSDVRWHRQLVNMFTPSSPSLPLPLPSSAAPRRRPSQSQDASTRPLPVPPVPNTLSLSPNLPSTTHPHTNANADNIVTPNSAGGSSSQTWTSSSSTRAAAAARGMDTGTISPPPPYQHQRQSVRSSVRNGV